MTIQELFDYLEDVKPHAFPEERLILWLNELESRIQLEVFLLHPKCLITYRWPGDKNTELLLDPPNDTIYRHWMEAMLDYANGEYSKYQNTAEIFNTSWNTFVSQFATTYRPADGYSVTDSGGFSDSSDSSASGWSNWYD